MPKEIDEDLIEATIRRVAESKAARLAGPAIEMPVDEARAPEFAQAAEDGADAPPLTADLDEAADDAPPPPPPPAPAPAPAPVIAAREALDDVAEPPAAPAPLAPPPAAAAAAAPALHVVAPSAALGGEEDGVPALADRLHQLIARLDALVPVLERIAASGTSGFDARGDEWAPLPPPRAPIAPPRPTVLRDGSALAADADVIDTRPLPKPLPPLVEPRRGLELLPRTYRITVEDKRRGVDLVPLHRAMLGIDGVRDMSLLSYSNGTAIVALETEDALEPEDVRLSMQNAMQRDARIEVHNENTMVVKLTPED
jgi:hypothetical protein